MILWSDAPQGSDAWLSVRRGAITGSRAKDARDRTAKGAPSAKMLGYAMDLARERVGGEVPAVFANAYMRKGTAEEEPARCRYEQRTGNLVETKGFAFTEDGYYGCSVDGLVHLPVAQPMPIVWECKEMVSSATLFKAVVDGDISDYRDQCLFNCWLLRAGAVHLWLDAWDIPELSRLIVIERDEAEMQALEDDMLAFNLMVEGFADKLRARMAPAPTVPAVPTPRPAVIKTPAQPVALPENLFV